MWEAPQTAGRSDSGLLTVQEAGMRGGEWEGERVVDYNGILFRGPNLLPHDIIELGAFQSSRRSKKGISNIKSYS